MSPRGKMWTALWAVYIIWGSTYLAIAVAGETIPPLLAVSSRFVLAGLIMAAVVSRRGATMRVSRPAFASCALVGCLLPGANAVLFFAEQRVPIGVASLLIASVPLLVVVLRLLGRERLPASVLAGVGVGFVGVAILAHPSSGASVGGILLCIVSAIMWAVGSVASSRLPMPSDPFTATAWEMLVGGVLMLPAGIATAGSFTPSAWSLVAWLYLVTFGSVVGYTAYVWLLANAPLGITSTYAYVNPVVAIILGVIFRGEDLTVRILVGAGIVISAVALVVGREPPSATYPEEGVR